MRNKVIFTSLLLIVSVTIFMSYDMINYKESNTPSNTYSKIKIKVSTAEQLFTLTQNDISLEHYQGNFKDGIEVVISQSEIARLKSTGIPYDIMIADMNNYYENRPQPTALEMQRSKTIQQQDNVQGFSYGSMGGFLTYAEVVQKLDSMRIQYPNLITVKQNRGQLSKEETFGR